LTAQLQPYDRYVRRWMPEGAVSSCRPMRQYAERKHNVK